MTGPGVEGRIDPATGRVYVNKDGTVWVPLWNGTQRPPFQPGNTMRLLRPHLNSGAASDSLVAPIAAQIAAELKGTRGLEHLRHRSFAILLDRYAKAEARRRMYAAWVEKQTFDEATAPSPVHSALERLGDLAAAADRAAEQCGLTPTSPPKVAEMVAKARMTIDRQALRKKLHDDLKDAARHQMYPGDYGDRSDV